MTLIKRISDGLMVWIKSTNNINHHVWKIVEIREWSALANSKTTKNDVRTNATEVIYGFSRSWYI